MYDFDLTDDQKEKFEDWRKSQRKIDPEIGGAIGGRWVFKFTPTGIGTFIEVEDLVLKETLSLTDYDKL